MLLLDKQLTMSQECTFVARKINSILGRIKIFDNRVREVNLSLCSLLWTHLECWVQFGTAQYKTDMDLLQWVQHRARKVIRELNSPSHEERLRELGL